MYVIRKIDTHTLHVLSLIFQIFPMGNRLHRFGNRLRIKIFLSFRSPTRRVIDCHLGVIDYIRENLRKLTAFLHKISL